MKKSRINVVSGVLTAEQRAELERRFPNRAKAKAPVVIEGRPGPRGLQGKQGPQGRPGLDGADGEDGQNGLPGAPGRPGRDGKAGPQGKPGRDGRNGEDGEDGAPGARGTPGKPGPKGKDGEDGEDGLSIRQGDGIPAPSLGKDGDSYVDRKKGDLYEKRSGQWFKTGNIKGPKGDKGPPGAGGGVVTMRIPGTGSSDGSGDLASIILGDGPPPEGGVVGQHILVGNGEPS